MRNPGIFAALALAACGGDGGSNAATLQSGDARLELSPDGATLTLSRGDKQLLVFGSDALWVGTVDSVAGTDSFDPYWLFVQAPIEPAGLVWRHLDAAQAMKLVTADTESMTIDLPFDGARGTLAITAPAEGRFALAFTATSGDDI